MFTYESTEVYTTIKNGKGKTTTKHTSIKNNKGTKTETIKNLKGKTLKKSKKTLNKNMIQTLKCNTTLPLVKF